MPVPLNWSQSLRELVNEWKSGNDKSSYLYLGDEPFDKFVLTERAESWDEFLRWLSELEGC